MLLRKRTWRLVALSAVARVLVACGSEGYDLTCSGAGDCLESELCHPTDKVCVQLCTTLVDCPTKADRCEAVSDPNGPSVCKCPTKECVSDREP